jgi:regulator of replication initiation timing
VSRFYRTELARAISDIRQDFDVLSQSQVNELEEYYRVKTEQVREEIASENERKRLLASEGVVESMDKLALSSSLKDHQTDLTSLQTENRQLQAEFDAIADDLERIQEEHSREKQSYSHELTQLRQEIDNRKTAIDELLENNVSLRFEMSTYRRLLDVEEKHLNRMEQEQDLPSLPTSSASYRVEQGQELSSVARPTSSSYRVEQGQELPSVARPTSSAYRVEQGQPLQSSPQVSSYQNQQTPDRSLADLGTKKMTVQKTARGS